MGKNKVGRPKLYKKTVVIPLRIEKTILDKSQKRAKKGNVSFNRYMNNLLLNDLKN